WQEEELIKENEDAAASADSNTAIPATSILLNMSDPATPDYVVSFTSVVKGGLGDISLSPIVVGHVGDGERLAPVLSPSNSTSARRPYHQITT
ncbi:hypothetical protein Pmani_008000, partial [Petrolisthes manimaculis]